MSYIRRAIVSIAALMLMLVFPAVSAAAAETPPEPTTTSTTRPCQTDMNPIEPRCLTPKELSLLKRDGWIQLDAGPSTEELLEQRIEKLEHWLLLTRCALVAASVLAIAFAIALFARKSEDELKRSRRPFLQ